MARPQQVSDEEILEVARSCFLEHGPGVATQLIAEKLGISSPALFNRFGSRESLMLRALKPEERPLWFQRIEHLPDGRSLDAQMREILELAMEYFEETIPRILCLRMSKVPMCKIMKKLPIPAPVLHQRAIAAWLSRCCEQGLARKAPFDALALAILGALHGHALLRFELERELIQGEQKGYVDSLTSFFLDGLRKDKDK